MIIFLHSCEKDEIEYYNLSFQNSYFETIDSIKFDREVIRTPIYVNEAYEYKNKIIKGVYNMSFYTESNLIINGQLNVIGESPRISVVILSNGNITVE